VPALVEEGYSFERLDQVPEYRQYDTPPPNAPVVASAVLGPATAVAAAAGLK